MLRFVAAAALSIACMLAGRAAAGARVRRAATLAALIEGLKRLEIDMLDKLLPLKEALMNGHAVPRAVAEAMRGCGAAEGWRRSRAALAARGGPLDCLTAEDLAALDALFDGLGATGSAQQRILIRGALEALAALRGEADRKAREESKLYSTLGLMAGLSLSILIM